AAAARVIQRVLPRRLRLRGRGTGGPCGGRTRPPALPPCGAAEQRAGGGDGGGARGDAVAGWGCARTDTHRVAGSGRSCTGAPALGGFVCAAVGRRVPAG